MPRSFEKQILFDAFCFGVAFCKELASPKIFKVHLGFSGTPSNVLPWTMPAVEFDEATDGQTLAILASPQVVSLQWLRSGWTPRTLLDLIATRQPPFCALIDTGALLCGLENEEVAKLLMEGPLSQVKEACVFLTRADLPMILLKGASHAVPLEDANILPEKRFCYFDQPHTTGIDIQQPPLGAASSVELRIYWIHTHKQIYGSYIYIYIYISQCQGKWVFQIQMVFSKFSLGCENWC